MPVGVSKYRGSKQYLIVYGELMAAARHRGTVTYQEIAEIMGLPLSGNLMGKEVGQLIGEISEAEASAGRPLLSAIVVGTSGVPGDGFYGWARELGKTVGDSSEDKLRFWETEKAAVYNTWKRELRKV